MLQYTFLLEASGIKVLKRRNEAHRRAERAAMQQAVNDASASWKSHALSQGAFDGLAAKHQRVLARPAKAGETLQTKLANGTVEVGGRELDGTEMVTGNYGGGPERWAVAGKKFPKLYAPAAGATPNEQGEMLYEPKAPPVRTKTLKKDTAILPPSWDPKTRDPNASLRSRFNTIQRIKKGGKLLTNVDSSIPATQQDMYGIGADEFAGSYTPFQKGAPLPSALAWREKQLNPYV